MAGAAGAIFDGLELSTRCNDTRPRADPTVNVERPARASPISDETRTVFVDFAGGSDSNPGTLASPVKTASHGLAVLRCRGLPGGANRTLVLRGGTHYLDAPLVIEHADAGLSITGHDGDTELAWLSGGVPLPDITWSKAAGNVYEADISELGPAVLAGVHSLRFKGHRATAARFPNADIELDKFPTGYVMSASSWLPPKTYPAAHVVTVESPSRQAIANKYTNYKLGIGGPCSVFDPPVSFWCSGTNGFTPSGLSLFNGTGIKPWSDPVGDGGEVFVWRSGHWNNWMFDIADFDAATRTVKFGKGGFQGTRPGGGDEFYFSHIREELDAPNEFFIDRKASKLFYIPNGTNAEAPPPSDGFVLTRVRTLLCINGTKDDPISDIAVTGIGFRDARATYMDPHGVPSGGDWGTVALMSLWTTPSVSFWNPFNSLWLCAAG